MFHLPRLLAALLPLLLVTALAAGCASREERLQKERARLESLRQLNNLRPGEGGPQEITGLSAPVPEEIASRPRPEWAGGGASLAYPPALYITGVGSAERSEKNDYRSLATAEDRARGELAKSIRVRVQAEFENAARLVTESASGTTATLQDRNETTDRIRSRADVELEGVHLVDRWYDRKSNTYWALAALERATAGRRLLDRMEQVRRQSGVDREMGQGFAAEGQRVQAATYLQRAAQAVYAVLNLRAQLSAIAPALLQEQPADPLPIAALMKDAADALERLRVKMAVFAKAEEATVSPADAEALIAAALRKEGVCVTRLNSPPPAGYDELVERSVDSLRGWAGEDTDILLLARLSTKQVAEQPMGKLLMHFYQARGNAVVLNMGAGRLLTSESFDWLPRSHSAHAERQRAAEAAMHEGAAELAERLRVGFIEALGLAKE